MSNPRLPTKKRQATPGKIINEAQVKTELRHTGKADLADNRTSRKRRGGNWVEPHPAAAG